MNWGVGKELFYGYTSENQVESHDLPNEGSRLAGCQDVLVLLVDKFSGIQKVTMQEFPVHVTRGVRPEADTSSYVGGRGGRG